MRFILMLPLLLAIGCGNLAKKADNRSPQTREDIEHYYVSSGVTQYYMADLPDWANFSYEGECQRGVSVRYLDYGKMAASYSLNYPQLVQFQSMLNKTFTEIHKSAKVNMVFAREEEVAFYDVYDRIKGGVTSFQIPEYNRVHLIWIDGTESEKQLLELFKSDFMSKGHPVLISLCMSGEQMEHYLKKIGIEDQNIALISAEMLSPFTSDLKISTSFNIDFGALFRNDQELHFFTTRDIIPKVFKGNFTYHKY